MRFLVFALVSTWSASALFCVSCASAPLENAGAPKDPSTTATTSTTGAEPASSTAMSSSTTLALTDAGDGQGTRLEAKSADAGTRRGEPGRTAEDVRTIILARREEYRLCYDTALKAHPGIEGDIDIKWVIDPKGTVTDISVDESKTTLREPSVGKCIMDNIRKIKFAESAKGLETTTHYPFNFNPKSGGRLGVPDAGK